MKDKLVQNGFIKVDGLERWFINFQGRTYYVIKDGGKWWILIKVNGSDITLNQTGYTEFKHIRQYFIAATLSVMAI